MLTLTRRVRSLSVHDSFGTKGWTLSVHDDFGTHDINFGACVFCSTTSVHAKYHFGTSLGAYVDIGTLQKNVCLFMLNVCNYAEWMFSLLC